MDTNLKSKKVYGYSIVEQLVTVFGLVMGATLLICFFVNNVMLDFAYRQHKERVLEDAYGAIRSAENDNSFESDNFNEELRLICDRYSLDVLVINPDSSTVKYIGADPVLLKLNLWKHMFGAPNEDEEEKQILKHTDKYEILISQDVRNGKDYMDIWGVLDSGNLFVMRTPLESIEDSVEIANRLLGIVGMFAIIVSAIIITFVAKRVSRPILELTSISEKMTELDFEAKYTRGGARELEELGDNINMLSETLKTTISELKSANLELERDNERKTQIDEMRKEFLSNVSHELKTPIALIQGYAEGLEDGIADDPESIKYYCDVILDEACKMNNLVSKLLTLNQLEFSNESVTLERFDIVEMLRGVVNSSSILLKQKEIDLSFPYTEPIYVWGDTFMAEEVISNYISNAINHCENDKRIDIAIEHTEGKVRVTVFNTGKAIPEDSIHHIWEKFYKVDKARTRSYGGSGIGLSIVAAVCNSLGQDYGVTNFEDGVAFWFELDS